MALYRSTRTRRVCRAAAAVASDRRAVAAVVGVAVRHRSSRGRGGRRVAVVVVSVVAYDYRRCEQEGFEVARDTQSVATATTAHPRTATTKRNGRDGEMTHDAERQTTKKWQFHQL